MNELKTKYTTFYYKEPKDVPVKKTVLFFALSADDSLNLSPFCHPVDSLLKNGIRVISANLPCHENNKRPLEIQRLWTEKIEEIETFIKNLHLGVKQIIQTFPPPYGAMGISRGCFIAMHLASLVEEITTITCFAPLLSLLDKEKLCISSLTPSLSEKNIHFFVGHNDTLIGTENVLNLNKSLISYREKSNPKSKSQTYTKISPSIGRQGHGTSDIIFEEGALWLKKNL